MKEQTMRKMGIITLSGLLLWTAGAAARASSTIVFQDSFNNGVVTDSDSIANYWTTSSGGTVGGTYSEATGPGGLTMTVARPASGNSQTHLETTTYNYLNFFDHAVTIDCSVAASFTTTGNPGVVRFTLGSQPLTDEYTFNDAVQVNIEPYPTFAKVTLQTKQDATYGAYTALTAQYPATLGRFVLTLDATTYSLSLYDSAGSLINATPYSGSLGLDSSKWGPSANSSQYNHDSAIDIEAIALHNSSDPGNLSANLTNLTITNVIPEPASLGMGLLGMSLLLLRRRA